MSILATAAQGLLNTFPSLPSDRSPSLTCHWACQLSVQLSPSCRLPSRIVGGYRPPDLVSPPGSSRPRSIDGPRPRQRVTGGGVLEQSRIGEEVTGGSQTPENQLDAYVDERTQRIIAVSWPFREGGKGCGQRSSIGNFCGECVPVVHQIGVHSAKPSQL